MSDIEYSLITSDVIKSFDCIHVLVQICLKNVVNPDQTAINGAV